MTTLECRNPLTWPTGMARTAKHAKSKFREPFLADDLQNLVYEISLIAKPESVIVVTADLSIGKSGRVLSNYRKDDDPGVSIFWTGKKGESDSSLTDKNINKAFKIADQFLGFASSEMTE